MHTLDPKLGTNAIASIKKWIKLLKLRDKWTDIHRIIMIALQRDLEYPFIIGPKLSFHSNFSDLSLVPKAIQRLAL